jgi:hypothetical protein
LGLERGDLVDELWHAKQSQRNNQKLNHVYLHAQQIEDKCNTSASDLVGFSKKQSL